MVYPPPQDRNALAAIPQKGIDKTKAENYEKDRKKCDYCPIMGIPETNAGNFMAP